MTRTFANRFNRMYQVDYFPEPQAFNFGNELIKIPGLNGTGKMGKSEGEGNAIFLSDEPEAIRKKVMKAVTDAGPTQPHQEKSQPIENLFQLMRAVSSAETLAYFEEQYDSCQIKYGEMKKQLAEDMITFTAPFREKIKDLLGNKDYLSNVARMGKEKAQENARKTIRDVREIIGFKSI
jgi:tryptophanyl-tRNA synthetase